MKTVTVHRGARDGYEVAKALAEAGLLERLVTDIYWPADRKWARRLEKFAPQKTCRSLRMRHAEHLPSRSVDARWISGIGSLLAHKTGWLPSDWQSRAIRWCDEDLGREAGRIASEKQAALLSYSYYGYSAFSNYTGPLPRILFQLHPHPAVVRSILKRERQLHPECASSLDSEWELKLPESDFQRLVDEVTMAQHWIVASQFTKTTLVECGISPERITVIPYGVDCNRFRASAKNFKLDRPLQLLFVGTLGQRKGIKYLLDALALLPPWSVELTVCGRPVDDLSLFRQSHLPVRLFPSISARGLREAYARADIFVFPSLAEGFGHVLLEAMASGLPIVSTNRTAAPDLIQTGREGFLVPAGSSADLAETIERFLRLPELVGRMGEAARLRAEYFTWERFRTSVADSVSDILAA